MTTFDTDPNTHTVAAGWSSSPLGQPEREVRYGFAAEPATEADDSLPVADAEDTRRPVAKHAIIAAALACGIAGGAALSLTLFEFDGAQPTVVVPGVGTSTQPVVIVTASGQAPSPTAVAPVPEPVRITTVAPAPASKAPTPDVAAPSAPGDSAVVFDIPIPDNPPLPEKPDQDDPEPPKRRPRRRGGLCAGRVLHRGHQTRPAVRSGQAAAMAVLDRAQRGATPNQSTPPRDAIRRSARRAIG